MNHLFILPSLFFIAIGFRSGISLTSADNNVPLKNILFTKVDHRVDSDMRTIVPDSIGINVQTRGVHPKNTPEANSRAIEALFKSIPEGSSASIYIPSGDYHFARTINIYRRPVYFFGDNGTVFGNGSKLYFPSGIGGILIERGGSSYQETILERLCIISKGKDPKRLVDGIAIRARVKIRDVSVKGFANNGFGVWANMEEGNDASGSLFQSCHSLENGNDGFFGGRVDGNAMSYINCDARDNGRYGFNDDSFLGNYYFGCMAHNNAKGHYYVRDKANARSSFIGCYGEMGSPVNDFSQRTTVVGGFLANGYDKHDGKGVIQQ